MHAEPLRVLTLRAADVLLRRAERRGAGNQRRVDAGVLPYRKRLHRVAREDLLLRHPLHVDERRGAGHGDRFGELADAKVGVDRRDEPGGDIDAFAPHALEPLQRERHRVGAGPEVDNPVAPFAIGHHRARAFDERRARGFRRHTREHPARFITYDTCDGAARGVLCPRDRRHSEKDQYCQGRRRPDHYVLLAPPVTRRVFVYIGAKSSHLASRLQ